MPTGLTPEITLPAPPLEYSMEPSEYQPYAEYTFHIEAEDFEPLDISGAEILPEVTALQTARLQAQTPENTFQNIVIPAHTLFGTYPGKNTRRRDQTHGRIRGDCSEPGGRAGICGGT
mgnify:CR=1 FL=1